MRNAGPVTQATVTIHWNPKVLTTTMTAPQSNDHPQTGGPPRSRSSPSPAMAAWIPNHPMRLTPITALSTAAPEAPKPAQRQSTAVANPSREPMQPTATLMRPKISAPKTQANTALHNGIRKPKVAPRSTCEMQPHIEKFSDAIAHQENRCAAGTRLNAKSPPAPEMPLSSPSLLLSSFDVAPGRAGSSASISIGLGWPTTLGGGVGEVAGATPAIANGACPAPAPPRVC
mmetsp:Transcript_24014/g.72141  ORF Transcript_24014/g.72141 Transcript_24014/m.72141 type:complete len:230 (+) Transcript_24014:293-982(+)